MLVLMQRSRLPTPTLSIELATIFFVSSLLATGDAHAWHEIGPHSGPHVLTCYGGCAAPHYDATACGGSTACCSGCIDGTWWYATEQRNFGCGAKLELRRGDLCVVVEVADNGPADFVEANAAATCGGTGWIIDASPLVADYFGGGCGWSECFWVDVREVDASTPTGPEGCEPLNEEPRGWLDSVDCNTGRITGWAQDPDDPDAPIDVHFYFDGVPGGSPALAYAVSADVYRDDLCGAIGSCAHGFSEVLPPSMRDDATHVLHVYGIDTAGGSNPELSGSGLTFSCPPPPLPLTPDQGVRRHITSSEVLGAWGFEWSDIARQPDDVLDAYPLGSPIDAGPRLVSGAEDTSVYLDDSGTLRHVVDPESFGAWGFDWGAIEAVDSAALDSLLLGASLPDAPYLVRGSGPEVWLMDRRPALWAEYVSDSLPDALAAGPAGGREVSMRFRNSGSIAWEPGMVSLVTTSPRGVASELCDAETWSSCDLVGDLDERVEPGGEGEISFRIVAAQASPGTSLSQCWNLSVDGHLFSDDGQGGPADDEICYTVAVVEPGEVEGDGDVDSDGDVDVDVDGDGDADGSGDELDGSIGLTGGCGCHASGSSRTPWPVSLLSLLTG